MTRRIRHRIALLIAVIMVLGLVDLAAYRITGLPILAVW